VTDALLNKIMN